MVKDYRLYTIDIKTEETASGYKTKYLPLLTIGDSESDKPEFAYDIQLKESTKDIETLTFSIPKTINGVENIIASDLASGTHIGLSYKKPSTTNLGTYETIKKPFYIDNITENRNKNSIIYNVTCKFLFHKELGRKGYDITFSEALGNNYGDLEYFISQLELEKDGWTVIVPKFPDYAEKRKIVGKDGVTTIQMEKEYIDSRDTMVYSPDVKKYVYEQDLSTIEELKIASIYDNNPVIKISKDFLNSKDGLSVNKVYIPLSISKIEKGAFEGYNDNDDEKLEIFFEGTPTRFEDITTEAKYLLNNNYKITYAGQINPPEELVFKNTETIGYKNGNALNINSEADYSNTSILIKEDSSISSISSSFDYISGGTIGKITIPYNINTISGYAFGLREPENTGWAGLLEAYSIGPTLKAIQFDGNDNNKNELIWKDNYYQNIQNIIVGANRKIKFEKFHNSIGGADKQLLIKLNSSDVTFCANCFGGSNVDLYIIYDFSLYDWDTKVKKEKGWLNGTRQVTIKCDDGIISNNGIGEEFYKTTVGIMYEKDFNSDTYVCKKFDTSIKFYGYNTTESIGNGLLENLLSISNQKEKTKYWNYYKNEGGEWKTEKVKDNFISMDDNGASIFYIDMPENTSLINTEIAQYNFTIGAKYLLKIEFEGQEVFSNNCIPKIKFDEQEVANEFIPYNRFKVKSKTENGEEKLIDGPNNIKYYYFNNRTIGSYAEFLLFDNLKSKYKIKNISLFKAICKEDKDGYELIDNNTKEVYLLVDNIIEPTEDTDAYLVNKSKIYYYENEKYSPTYIEASVELNNKKDEQVTVSDKGLATIKKRTYTKKQSNKYNIINELAKSFGVIAKFYLDEKNYPVLTFESVREVAPRAIGFVYGVNLNNTEKTIKSDSLITKLFVNNFTTNNRNISISEYTESKDNILYNFDYYINNGKLSAEVYNDLKKLNQQLSKSNTDLNEANQKLIKNESNKVENETAIIKYDTLIKTTTEEKLRKYYQKQTQKENGYQTFNEFINAIATMVKTTWTGTSDEDKKIIEKLSLLTEDDLEDAKTMYRTRKDAEIQLVELNSAKSALEKEWNSLKGSILSIKHDIKVSRSQFENKYKDYIFEGNWQNTNISDNSNYYLEALNNSNIAAKPVITYNFSPLDISYEDENVYFNVGDFTFVLDEEISPNKEKVLITEKTTYFDKSTPISFTLSTVDEEYKNFFEKVAQAVATFDYNKNSYEKANNFTAEGQIDLSVLQKSLSVDTLSLLKKRGIILDETGLHIKNPYQPDTTLDLTINGLQISKNGQIILSAGNEAGVTVEGTIYATNGEFSGTIRSKDGEIGHWLITENGIEKGNMHLTPDSILVTKNNGETNFEVTKEGKLIANEAYIKGHIEASSGSFKGRIEAESGEFKGRVEANGGKIGDWNIGRGLESKNGVVNISPEILKYGDNFTVERDGTVNALAINASSWNISELQMVGKTLMTGNLYYGRAKNNKENIHSIFDERFDSNKFLKSKTYIGINTDNEELKNSLYDNSECSLVHSNNGQDIGKHYNAVIDHSMKVTNQDAIIFNNNDVKLYNFDSYYDPSTKTLVKLKGETIYFPKVNCEIWNLIVHPCVSIDDYLTGKLIYGSDYWVVRNNLDAKLYFYNAPDFELVETTKDFPIGNSDTKTLNPGEVYLRSGDGIFLFTEQGNTYKRYGFESYDLDDWINYFVKKAGDSVALEENITQPVVYYEWYEESWKNRPSIKLSNYFVDWISQCFFTLDKDKINGDFNGTNNSNETYILGLPFNDPDGAWTNYFSRNHNISIIGTIPIKNIYEAEEKGKSYTMDKYIVYDNSTKNLYFSRNQVYGIDTLVYKIYRDTETNTLKSKYCQFTETSEEEIVPEDWNNDIESFIIEEGYVIKTNNFTIGFGAVSPRTTVVNSTNTDYTNRILFQFNNNPYYNQNDCYDMENFGTNLWYFDDVSYCNDSKEKFGSDFYLQIDDENNYIASSGMNIMLIDGDMYIATENQINGITTHFDVKDIFNQYNEVTIYKDKDYDDKWPSNLIKESYCYIANPNDKGTCLLGYISEINLEEGYFKVQYISKNAYIDELSDDTQITFTPLDKVGIIINGSENSLENAGSNSITFYEKEDEGLTRPKTILGKIRRNDLPLNNPIRPLIHDGDYGLYSEHAYISGIVGGVNSGIRTKNKNYNSSWSDLSLFHYNTVPYYELLWVDNNLSTDIYGRKMFGPIFGKYLNYFDNTGIFSSAGYYSSDDVIPSKGPVSYDKNDRDVIIGPNSKDSYLIIETSISIDKVNPDVALLLPDTLLKVYIDDELVIDKGETGYTLTISDLEFQTSSEFITDNLLHHKDITYRSYDIKRIGETTNKGYFKIRIVVDTTNIQTGNKYACIVTKYNTNFLSQYEEHYVPYKSNSMAILENGTTVYPSITGQNMDIDSIESNHINAGSIESRMINNTFVKEEIFIFDDDTTEIEI